MSPSGLGSIFSISLRAPDLCGDMAWPGIGIPALLMPHSSVDSTSCSISGQEGLPGTAAEGGPEDRAGRLRQPGSTATSQLCAHTLKVNMAIHVIFEIACKYLV